MLPIQNVTYTKCYLYEMLPMQSVLYENVLFKMLLDKNVLFKILDINVLFKMLLYENVKVNFPFFYPYKI